jgi:hypothetical protein
MWGRVVTRERVLGHEEPEHEHVDRDAERALVLELREDEARRRVVARDEEQDNGDGDDPEHVPPRAHVGQERDDLHTEGVEHAMDEEDGGVDDQDVARRVLVARRQVQEHGEERGEPEIDAGGDGNLSE